MWRLPFNFQLPITKGCRIFTLHALGELMKMAAHQGSMV
ncbi:Hypothetical protein ABZS17G119_04063 [Kosakonia cowanii]